MIQNLYDDIYIVDVICLSKKVIPALELIGQGNIRYGIRLCIQHCFDSGWLSLNTSTRKPDSNGAAPATDNLVHPPDVG